MSQWACQQCTLLNDSTLQQCEICDYKRSSEAIHNHCTESDLQYAIRLQHEYNKDTNTENKSTDCGTNSLQLNETPTPQKSAINLSKMHNNHNHNNSNSNSAVSPNSNSSISSPIKEIRRNPRKRKRAQLAAYSDDEDNEDLKMNPIKFKIVEQEVEYKEYYLNDIIHKIGCDFLPRWDANFVNPVASNKINVTISPDSRVIGGGLSQICEPRRYDSITTPNVCIAPKLNTPNVLPYFIVDCKDLQIKLNRYQIEHPTYYRYDSTANRHVMYGQDNYLRGWSLDASNDLINWTRIHSVSFAEIGTETYSYTANCVRGDVHWNNENNSFYTKYRFRMTRKNSDGVSLLKMRSFQLYGSIRRRIENKARINEHIAIDNFPAISSKKCLGDISNVFAILNEFDGIQHNECKEYMDDVPHLKVQLKDYQRSGLQWMLDMENNGNADGIHGGLICDEMGLGKTVQIIALMLVQSQQSETRDRSIIITPLSLIDQWIQEIKKIAGPDTFEYINYYGSNRKKLKKCDFDDCDIVFSTTATFANGIGKLERVYDHWKGEYWTKTNKQELIFKLPANYFSRIVIDESHEIKNTQSNRSNAICTFSLRCRSRWCLTGTPIKSNIISDLAGMVRFLGITHSEYQDSLKLSMAEKTNELKVRGSMNTSKRNNFWLDLNHEYCIHKIEDYLQKIMIRRTKQQVLHNGFVEKEEIVIKCELNEEEQVIYDKNANEAKQQYQQFKRENIVMGKYLYLLRMLTKLRQICDHCSLVFNRCDGAETDGINTSNIMDLESNIDILQRVGELIISRLNEMESLIDYECPICYELSELNGVMLSDCGHLFCKECVSDLLAHQQQQCPMCRSRFTQRNVLKITHILQSKQLDERHLEEFEKYQNDEKNEEKVCDNKKYDNYEEFVRKHSDLSYMSSKINALIERLDYIFQHHQNDKVLVFSNFTNMFNIISRKLSIENIDHLQFHGSMNRKQRKVILDEFQNEDKYNVLLISAKCASVGLNLMCANHVIFLEPRCNVGLDNQAIGRVWRIGQTKKVYVTRLIFKNTVEETILKLQQHKGNNELNSNVVDLKQKSKLNEEDYDIIFAYDDAAAAAVADTSSQNDID